MADLYASYFGGVSNCVGFKPLGTEIISTSGSSARGAGNAPRGASIVTVHSDAAHYIAVGPAATVEASASNGVYVPANVTREIAIGRGEEVAAILVT